MDNIDKISDDILDEIIKIEHEINILLGLNGNKETKKVKKYRQLIAARKTKLNLLNDNYEGWND
jgi:hypothetical protein